MKKNDKHRLKKGFTLIEVIVSLALFIIIGTLITIFVIKGNNMLSQSYQINRNREDLRNTIDTGKSITGDNIINNVDSGKFTNREGVLDSRGKSKVTGRVLINPGDAIVIGPSLTEKHNIVVDAKKIDVDIDKIGTVDSKIEIATGTKYDSEGKPIVSLSEGYISKR